MNVSVNELKEVTRLTKGVIDLYHEIASREGLSDSAFNILYAIIELGDGCLQIDISNRAILNKQTVNSSIRNLEKKGYIVLTSGKGREMQVFLTEEGKQICRNKIFPIMELEKNVFTQMTAEERSEYFRLTNKYYTLLKEQVDKYFYVSSENLRPQPFG